MMIPKIVDITQAKAETATEFNNPALVRRQHQITWGEIMENATITSDIHHTRETRNATTEITCAAIMYPSLYSRVFKKYPKRKKKKKTLVTDIGQRPMQHFSSSPSFSLSRPLICFLFFNNCNWPNIIDDICWDDEVWKCSTCSPIEQNILIEVCRFIDRHMHYLYVLLASKQTHSGTIIPKLFYIKDGGIIN